jgi:hypothetical protein
VDLQVEKAALLVPNVERRFRDPVDGAAQALAKHSAPAGQPIGNARRLRGGEC